MPKNKIRYSIPYLEDYEIDEDGKVYSLIQFKYLKENTSYTGYKRVKISGKKYNGLISVHSLVALTFIGPRPYGYDINHKDGIKANNNVDNLEYCTKSYNQLHAYKLGLRQRKSGFNSKCTKLSKADTLKLLADHRSGITCHDLLAWKYEIGKSTVGNILARYKNGHYNDIT